MHKTWCLCYLPQPSASADNTDLGFDNSWYHAQPHPIYRDFRPITHTAHYPHRSIFAIKGKNCQQITRTENKRKSWFKVSPYLTKLDQQAIELFSWLWIDSTYKSQRLKKILPSSCQFYASSICPVNYSMHVCLDLLECTAAERNLVDRLLKSAIF